MKKISISDEIKRKMENLTPFEDNVPNTEQQRDALKRQLVDYLSEWSDGDFEVEVQGGSSEAEVNVKISTDDPVLAAILEEMKGDEEDV